jgi:hypothetical protein
MPERIAALLHVVRILLGYGRHLADTLKDRTTAPGFTAIAACFGTANLGLILAHLHRGLLRAAALERVLLARAASGRDIVSACSRIRTTEEGSAPADAASKPVAHNPVRLARSIPQNHPTDFHTPTLQELELQVRRRPLGRTIVDICLDLAVVPGFCTGAFWNELFGAMQCYGGSVTNMMRERFRREQAFLQEQERTPTQDRDSSILRRQLVRQVLGFFVGEEPVLPYSQSAMFAPASALATGPP